MNKRDTTLFVLVLVAIWLGLDLLNHAVFHRVADLYFYSLLDLAFLPLEVILLYFVVDKLLGKRERQSRLHKLNMVIGTFFSACGRPLLKLLTNLVRDREDLAAHLAIAPGWEQGQIKEAINWVQATDLQLDASPAALAPIREFLAGQREFIIRLLENPTLLEHEQFTDLLWAISHLEEELTAREDLEGASPADLDHLAGDSERAYCRLLAQWLDYMTHLKAFYPYLFSFAARTNPLREGAKAEFG